MRSFFDTFDALKGGGHLDGMAAREGGFMFAAGIECSWPTVGNGRMRRDLLDECVHHARWAEDLDLVRAMGLRDPRRHRVHLGPGRCDWGFADAVMEGMRARGIVQIFDLRHWACRSCSTFCQTRRLAGVPRAARRAGP